MSSIVTAVASGVTAVLAAEPSPGRRVYLCAFEGEERTDTSVILEPSTNGEVIPTFKVEDWMFKKG